MTGHKVLPKKIIIIQKTLVKNEKYDIMNVEKNLSIIERLLEVAKEYFVSKKDE